MSDVDPRIELAYEESVRALDMQNETLNELHSRTGVVIAAVTVASAFPRAAGSTTKSLPDGSGCSDSPVARLPATSSFGWWRWG
ncbi:MAG TPA: hypothetical protein VKV16_05265 [Solirubrobacteraceae bacterium]|nr:hypothetical protein [Solirubrobacteraceae bacterium]